MNDEVKEILEALKPHNDIIKEYPLALSIEEQKLLSDYITNLENKYENQIHRYMNLKEYTTNLQEEAAILRKQKKKLSNDLAEAILFNQKRCEQNKKSQQRIDKAIEYIDDKVLSNGEVIDQLRIIEVEKLLNILNGGDE